MSQDIRTTLQSLARQHLGRTADLPEGELSDALDSLQLLSLVVAIEDHFEILFDADDDEGARTVDDVVRIIEAKLEKKGA